MNTATRAVALNPSADEGGLRFTDNNDGTVTDTRAGLMWSKATLTPSDVTHHDATKICEDLELAGFNDWRLPTVEELFALADRSKQTPAIDTEAFPDTKSDYYWSSTICAWSSVYAWVVSFDLGDAGYLDRDYDSGLVRAVRSVAPGQ